MGTRVRLLLSAHDLRRKRGHNAASGVRGARRAHARLPRARPVPSLTSIAGVATQTRADQYAAAICILRAACWQRVLRSLTVAGGMKTVISSLWV